MQLPLFLNMAELIHVGTSGLNYQALSSDVAVRRQL